MNTDFPEDIFDSKLKNQSLYKYKSDLGQKISSNKKIVFAGICRNVGDTLALNIERIIRTASQFKDSHIFLYENDSTDNTVEILNYYKNKINLAFLSEKRDDSNYRQDITNGVDPWHFNRCKILANCRNFYLKYALAGFFDYDYLCVLDLDIKGGWSYTGFNHGIYTLESDDKYACVSSYGVISEPDNAKKLEEIDIEEYIMYDSLAFRPLNTVGGIHILDTPLFNKMSFYRGEDPIEVISNFGGMAIYKLPLLEHKKYGAKQWNEGEVDPDHVILHRQLINDGHKIILDPSMIVSYSDHKFSKETNDKHTISY